MQDPLNMTFGTRGVDTSIPVLPENNYALQITEVSVEPNKDKSGHNLVVTLNTTAPIASIPGDDGTCREVKPGFPLKLWLALQAKAGSTDPEAYVRSLSDFIDAALGTTKDNRPDLTLDPSKAVQGQVVHVGEFLGKVVNARVTIEDFQGRKTNSVRRLSKLS